MFGHRAILIVNTEAMCALYQALAKSFNVPTVQLGMALGIDNVSKTLQQLGVDGQEIRPVPAMLLGHFHSRLIRWRKCIKP
ncbi:hypothetical protein ACT691_12945 [Vibrio metschnikovii]